MIRNTPYGDVSFLGRSFDGAFYFWEINRMIFVAGLPSNTPP
jgi:hypothetical protein